MGKLSVVINAFNEEKKIEGCLRSVDFADEIILIDSSSTDKTSEIGKKYGAKIFKKENNPMLNTNKNFGFSKATGEWILSLDADERITPELKKEIVQKIKEKGSDTVGYYIPRRNIIFGKPIYHAGWYPDHQLRLFRKGKGKFEEKHVHEMLIVKGNTDYLKTEILHNNYENISQFIRKMDTYTSNEADQLVESGYILKWQDAIGMPTREFTSRYFARKGFEEGLHGLVLSILMAFYHFVVFAKIWEKSGFKEYGNDNFLTDIKKELSNSNKEISYWIKKTKVDKEKNPIKKTLRKIVNKLG